MQDGYIKNKKKSAESFKTRKPDIHCAKSQSADWVSWMLHEVGNSAVALLALLSFLLVLSDWPGVQSEIQMNVK